MLISKQQSNKRGESKSACLIPELCRMTGLSAKMRINFELMRKLADSTRLGPSQRIQRLNEFNKRLCNNEQVILALL